MPTVEKVNIAVLIDAENVDPSFADQIFSYARSLGVVTIREIYGSGISLNEWSDAILENTIHTNFTLRPNRFKNSSDISLVIGAMGKPLLPPSAMTSMPPCLSPMMLMKRTSGNKCGFWFRRG